MCPFLLLPGSTWICWCPSMWWGKCPVSSLNSLTWALNSSSTWENKNLLWDQCNIPVLQQCPHSHAIRCVCLIFCLLFQFLKWIYIYFNVIVVHLYKSIFHRRDLIYVIILIKSNWVVSLFFFTVYVICCDEFYTEYIVALISFTPLFFFHESMCIYTFFIPKWYFIQESWMTCVFQLLTVLWAS